MGLLQHVHTNATIVVFRVHHQALTYGLCKPQHSMKHLVASNTPEIKPRMNCLKDRDQHWTRTPRILDHQLEVHRPSSHNWNPLLSPFMNAGLRTCLLKMVREAEMMAWVLEEGLISAQHWSRGEGRC